MDKKIRTIRDFEYYLIGDNTIELDNVSKRITIIGDTGEVAISYESIQQLSWFLSCVAINERGAYIDDKKDQLQAEGCEI